MQFIQKCLQLSEEKDTKFMKIIESQILIYLICIVSLIELVIDIQNSDMACTYYMFKYARSQLMYNLLNPPQQYSKFQTNWKYLKIAGQAG